MSAVERTAVIIRILVIEESWIVDAAGFFALFRCASGSFRHAGA